MSAVVLGAMVCVPVQAQVRQVQTGHALDMQLDTNLQVGGGRYNMPTPSPNLPNAELIARGQVTGLAGFAGQGLVAPNQLRVTTPTSYLDRFMGQSVGVEQAKTGSNYAPTAFYVPSRTVYESPRGSVNTASSYAVSGSASGAAVEQAHNEARRLYDVVLPPVPRVTRSVAHLPQFSVPVDMSVTGMSATPEQKQREGLSRELIDAQNALRAANVPGFEAGANPPPGPAIGGQRTHGIIDPQDPEMLMSTRGGPIRPKKGQDAFSDLAMLMQEQREKLGGVPMPKSPAEDAPGLAPGEADEPLVRLQNDQLVVEGLAGNSGDMFNQFMARGQVSLKTGRYYEAARIFEMASILDNANPLAMIGQGAALLGAGEFYSAALLFRRAMETFPPIMETRVNMAGMMQEGDFAKRLNEVNERANPKEADSAMLMLAAFVNRSAGNTRVARTYATRLAECDDIQPIVQTFALYVKTGKVPKVLPAKQTSKAAASSTSQPAAPRPNLNLPTTPKSNQPAAPAK